MIWNSSLLDRFFPQFFHNRTHESFCFETEYFKEYLQNIYKETDNPSAITSITGELDLKSKDKEYISVARQFELIFDKTNLQNFLLNNYFSFNLNQIANNKLQSYWAYNSKHFELKSMEDKVP